MSVAGYEASADQGQPIELYEFSYQATYQRFTSAAEPIVLGAFTYLPYAMARSNLSEKSGSYEQPLTISAFRDFPPAGFFRFQTPSAVMGLAVRRKHYLDDATQYIVAWMGRVMSATWKAGNQVDMLCESDLSAFKRNALKRHYQRGCPWALYGPGCKLNPVDFQNVAHIFGVTGRTVAVSSFAALPTNYFAGGYLQYINSLTGIQEYIWIRSSDAGNLNLSLVPIGLADAGELIAYPGCAHDIPTCDTKFNNRPNYGGQPSIPTINPMAGKILY